MNELSRRIVFVLAAWVAGCACLVAGGEVQSRIRVERLPVSGGAELVTLICTLPDNIGSGREFPLISVLRDTMGDSDPSNDALRNVWVLTYARPSILQRIAAGLPFFYMRVGSPHGHQSSLPSSILDMGAVGRRTWPKLIRAAVQSEMLDTLGIPVRASTRAYAGNATDFRNEHIWHALGVLSAVRADAADGLSQQDLERLEARLSLSTSLLGDLVSEAYLPAAFEKENQDLFETRSHNWELLRQKAEENGLYFEPLSLGLSKSAHVLFWAERKHYNRSEIRTFNSQFLGIANPFEGDWLKKWNGYVENWTLNHWGNRVAPATPDSRIAEMVPVALYSLDHSRAPLLLVDFRRPSQPKRREMIHRAADQMTTGVLGLAKFGNWGFLAANATWRFVRGRHGASTDASVRLRAYAQLRHALFLDESLDPRLKRELIHRLERVAINPFESDLETEAGIARQQYARLCAAVSSPGGLPKLVARERSGEAARERHSASALAAFRFANVMTLGMYRHDDRVTPELLAEVDRRRRFAWNKRFLEDVLDSTPQAEVAFNIGLVQRSLEAITEIGESDDGFRAESEQLVRRVLAQTSDEITRQRCLVCLQKLAKAAPLPVISAGGGE